MKTARSGFLGAGRGRGLLLPLLAPAILLAAACAAAQAGDEPMFENVAGPAKLGGVPTVRSILADLNSDGWLDAVLDRSRVFLSTADESTPFGRSFLDATETSGLAALFTKGGKVVPPQFLLAGDVDNDGDPDLFAARYCEMEKPAKGLGNTPAVEAGSMLLEWKDEGFRSEILLNDGMGRFSVLRDSGVSDPPETVCAGTFLDYDRDGVLDLFTGSWYVAYGYSYDCYPDRLLRGTGGGRFADVTSRAGLFTLRAAGYRNSSRPTYGVAHCDFNNDGWQDLLVCAYGRQWNVLWKNNGDGTFTDVSGETGFDGDADSSGEYPPQIRRQKEPPFRANGNTFAVTCGDFDNDGDIDLFTGEIAHWWAGPSSDRSCLLVNQGPSAGFKFERAREERGFVRAHAGDQWNEGDLHVGWIDADNDGLLDLVIASSDYPDDQVLRLFLQKPDNSFEDVTARAGFNWRNPTGISFGDFDRDGRTDILVGNNNMRLTAEQRAERPLEAALFRNVCAPENHFLTVRLRGSGTGGANSQGIGARVEVTSGGRTMVREIYGGGGHCGQQNPPLAHFGLGSSDKIDLLRVFWPGARVAVQEFKEVPADCFILLREGEDRVEVERSSPRTGKAGKTGEPGEEDF